MRIVGGKFRGRQFRPGKSFRSRPTTDFSKESLFNILENRIVWEDTSALDLFAGTGSISYELISRGCRNVTAVELDGVHCRFIRESAKLMGISNLLVLKNDVFRFLEGCDASFELIFADPPYTMKELATVPLKVLGSGVLKAGGLFILEHSKDHIFTEVTGFREQRKYGSVNFSFFTGI